MNKARQSLIQGDLESFANHIQEANRLSAHRNYRSFLLAVSVPLSLLEEMSHHLPEDKKKDVVDQALYYLHNAQAINPRSASALFYWGQLKTLAPESLLPKNLKSPEHYYKQALEIDPLHLGATIELAKIYQRQNRSKQALEILERWSHAKHSSPKALEYYQMLANAYIVSGDVEKNRQILIKHHHLRQKLTEHYQDSDLDNRPAFVQSLD